MSYQRVRSLYKSAYFFQEFPGTYSQMHLMRFASLGIFEIRNVPVWWRPMSSPAQTNRPSVVAIATATMTAVVAIQVSVRELKTHLCE